MAFQIRLDGLPPLLRLLRNLRNRHDHFHQLPNLAGGRKNLPCSPVRIKADDDRAHDLPPDANATTTITTARTSRAKLVYGPPPKREGLSDRNTAFRGMGGGVNPGGGGFRTPPSPSREKKFA